MARIFMTHQVTDYAKWKATYDADAERRAGAGLRDAGHFHHTADENNFLIVWDVDADVDGATAMINGMMSDPNLGKVMEEAGVVGKPEFWVA